MRRLLLLVLIAALTTAFTLPPSSFSSGDGVLPERIAHLPLEKGWGEVKTNAQTIPTWYYGWNFETGELAAYNLAGNTVSLLTIDVDIQPVGWRLDAERALAVLSVNGVSGLYVLSSSGATQVVPTLGAEFIIPQLQFLGGRYDPYIVLVAENGAFGLGVLVNLSRNIAEPLSGETFLPLDNWRFSLDGAVLRYLSREDRETQTWSLWERDLASDNERGIHSFDSPFPVIQASTTGSQWLYRVLQDGQMTYTVVLSDGGSQVLAQIPVPNPTDPMTVYQLYGDNLLVYVAPCESGCTIEQRPLAGGSVSNYTPAAIPSPQIEPLYQISPTQLIAFIQDTFWLLDTTGSLPLATYSGEVFSQPPDELVSSDGAWVTGLDGAGNVQVVSVANRTPVLTAPIATRMSVLYGSGGVLVSGTDPRQTAAYRFSDGATFQLPHTSGDFYAEALTDGTMLLVLTNPVEGRPAGIYRYNPVDGAYILVAENLFPLDVD